MHHTLRGIIWDIIVPLHYVRCVFKRSEGVDLLINCWEDSGITFMARYINYLASINLHSTHVGSFKRPTIQIVQSVGSVRVGNLPGDQISSELSSLFQSPPSNDVKNFVVRVRLWIDENLTLYCCRFCDSSGLEWDEINTSRIEIEIWWGTGNYPPHLNQRSSAAIAHILVENVALA